MLCEDGAYSVRGWVGVCTGALKLLPYQWHIPAIQLILWEYIAQTLKCFALVSLDQQELHVFNFPSNARFCILDVWQGFIRTVVLRLLSRGTNFHNNKHIRNYTQDRLQSKIGNCMACC